jgi:hypothetical protein
VPAGYSKTPLIDKLGIKPGKRLRVVNQPPQYFTLLGSMPDDVMILRSTRGEIDFAHLFVTNRSALLKEFPKLKANLAKDGMLWVSWPKGGSSIDTDLKEDIVRQVGLASGLVDIKICAVDEDWSGLKFVYRLKDRAPQKS